MKYLDLVGRKFKIDGRGPTEYDCYGLILELAKRRGFFLPEQNTPEGIEMRMKMFEAISSEFTEPIDKIEPWAVVVFCKGRLGRLHVGTALQDCRRFIHADHKGVRITRLNSIIWQRKIAGYYRLKKHE